MKRILMVGMSALLLAVTSFAADMLGSQAVSDKLWLTSAAGAKGDMVTVDLMIENGVTEVDAVTLTLKYDTSKLQYVDWADGSLKPGWVMFNINEKADGEIAIGGFCVKTAIKPGSRGSLATLSFKVKSEVKGDAGYVSFETIRDDVEGFNFENGKIEINGSLEKK